MKKIIQKGDLVLCQVSLKEENCIDSLDEVVSFQVLCAVLKVNERNGTLKVKFLNHPSKEGRGATRNVHIAQIWGVGLEVIDEVSGKLDRTLIVEVTGDEYHDKVGRKKSGVVKKKKDRDTIAVDIDESKIIMGFTFGKVDKLSVEIVEIEDIHH